ncbi:excinuclease ABC subunit C, partial [Streptomyces sp. SID10244]|nr:excinuclease ABC subunit C [Streptomyces sp. SID10244]
ITFHRSKRSKRMTESVLDGVPGLGRTRRTALVTHFGSVARLREATLEDISGVPGIGVATARAVREALAADVPAADAPAANAPVADPATADRVEEKTGD